MKIIRIADFLVGIRTKHLRDAIIRCCTLFNSLL